MVLIPVLISSNLFSPNSWLLGYLVRCILTNRYVYFKFDKILPYDAAGEAHNSNRFYHSHHLQIPFSMSLMFANVLFNAVLLL